MKKIIKSFKKGFYDKFSGWNSIDEDNNKSNQFEDLTPRGDLEIDEYKEYFDSLDWAISNKNRIKNIAITGTFGSGKSSIIRTFERNNPQLNFLNISLASFSDEIDEVKSSKNDQGHSDQRVSAKDYLNRLIERSILQQIFYRKKPQDIPKSRFKRIFAVSKTKTTIYSILFSIWLASVLEVFIPETFTNITVPEFLKFNEFINSNFQNLTLLVAFIGLIFFIYQLFRLLNGLTFSKLNLTKGEIELASHIDSSILNKHLDEIIYFFEEQKYDVVVIEDIDRYDNIDIFTKLREINILLNKSEQISYDIVFIYAIKDDLFKNRENEKNDRTKFFDFIIPIIPVINSSNSGEILLRKFHQEIEEQDISPIFLSDISYSVDDMRVLKNIYNEFVIYRGRLSSEYLDQEKILSMVIYKNLFPQDFSKLQNNKGDIFEVFSKYKRVYIEELKNELKSQIDLVEEKIERTKDENITSVENLKKVYLYSLFDKSKDQNNFPKYVEIDRNRVDVNDLISDKNFNQLKNSDSIQILDINRRRISTVTFAEIEEELKSDKSFDERKQLILNKSENKLQQLERDLQRLLKEQNQLSKLNLKDLLKKGSFAEILPDNLKKKSPLLFLLRSGHIDETYSYYVSNFYEGTLKRKDFDFVLSVKNHSALAYDHQITHLDEIINRLYEWEFSQSEILNFQLLSHLLAYESRYKKQLENFINLLSDESETSIEFIEKYIEDEKKSDRELLFYHLSKKWPNMWAYIDSKSRFDKSKKDKVLKLIILNAEIDDIVQLNKESNESLKKYIEEREYLSEYYFSTSDIEKFEKVLIRLQVKIKKLIKRESDYWEKLLSFLHGENLYELNEHMITLILEMKYNFSNSKINSFRESPYTSLMNSNSSDVVNYVKDNIERFVKNTLLSKESISEAPGYFVKLLNNENIKNSSKERLALKQSREIEDISHITDNTLWPILVGNSKVQPKWENVLEYYNNIGEVDQFLVDFINKGFDNDNLIRYRIKFDSIEERMKFLKATFSKKEINIKIKIKLLTAQISDISKDQVGELLNLLPSPYYRLNRSRKQPLFDNTDYNLHLIEKLQEKGFVGTIKKKEKSIRAYVRYFVPGKGK